MEKGFLRQLAKEMCDSVYEEWVRMRDRQHVVEMPFYLACTLVKCEKSFISLAPTGGLMITAAFEIIWVFSEIPSSAEGECPVGFSGSSQTALAQ